VLDSHIESLHVKHVRQFEDVKINFNEKFNFIAGPNGCGKTSILACISHCFNSSSLEYSRFNINSEFWTDLVMDGIKYRVGLNAGSINGNGYRNASALIWNQPESSQDRKTLVPHSIKDTLKISPLFIGAHRSIKYQRINGLTREELTENQLTAYLENGTRSIYGDRSNYTKQWLINRYFAIDKDWAMEEKKNWDHLISELPNIGPFDSNFRYVRTGKDLEPVFSIYEKECYLEELSSGFQAVLLIIANIIEWIEGSRPDGNRDVTEATGTVLIDELDLHLHPEWQFTIRNGLSKIFPRIQFIVTTHSPHLLASANSNEVIVMPKNHNDETYILSPSNRSFSGWNTDQILSEIMGVQSLDNKEYEKLVSDALKQIEKKDISELKNCIKRLSLACHPNDTILIILKTRLASLEALSND
jgi:energy-coupling factor transporter ATP-binding protein EcfA2